MRRTVQRCSASLPRSLSTTLRSTTLTSRFLLTRSSARIASHSSIPSVRAFHQTTRLQQEAAAASAPAAEGGDGQITRFEDLDTKGIIHPNVVKTITKQMGLETMTEVQAATINSALKGTDIIAQAKTGTGKTIAFLLPILQNVLNKDPELAERRNNFRGRGNQRNAHSGDIRAIIISPTRELAEQIAEEARKLVSNTGVIVQTAVGGTAKAYGLRTIQREGCHILVATPGRLKDILTDPSTKVEAPDLAALVFDEADRLLDQGFWPEIQEIMRLLPTAAEVQRQTLMFSATVPREVVDLVRTTLQPGFQFVKCVRDDEEPTHARIPQRVISVKGFENKIPTLIELCQKGRDASKEAGGRPFKAIVYFNSTAEVALAASTLHLLQTPGAEGQRFSKIWGDTRIFNIHARLNQGQRTRAADMFRTAESAILLSSDVTARGMDFPNVTHVIQMAIPPNREQYIHRLGRTGRAGKEGTGYLILNADESREARNRLRGLPLQADESSETAKIDLTVEGNVPKQAGEILAMVQKALQSVPLEEKSAVYRALLGVYGWYHDKRSLVGSMNNLAQFGWGMSEPPFIAPVLAQRLGLSRIPGMNVGIDPNQPPPTERRMGGGRDSFGGGRGGDRFNFDRRDRTPRDPFGAGRSDDRGGYAGSRGRDYGRNDNSGYSSSRRRDRY
nr:atp-dependent rna helicase, mitochondrial [Quercus suber]